MAIDNEFFVLVAPDYAFAADNTAITASAFTPDVVASETAITGATNVNPISITAIAHGLRSGMVVLIRDVGGNTAANGIWSITVTGVDTFTIPVAGNGTYTSGGFVDPNETAYGSTSLLGEVLVERDMLAINAGVVGPCSIFSITPSSKKRGSPTFTLIVNGEGFTSGGVVRWNAVDLATTFVSNTELHAIVPGTLLTVATAACITVADVGGISNSKSFLVSGGASNFVF